MLALHSIYHRRADRGQRLPRISLELSGTADSCVGPPIRFSSNETTFRGSKPCSHELNHKFVTPRNLDSTAYMILPIVDRTACGQTINRQLFCVYETSNKPLT